MGLTLLFQASLPLELWEDAFLQSFISLIAYLLQSFKASVRWSVCLVSHPSIPFLKHLDVFVFYVYVLIIIISFNFILSLVFFLVTVIFTRDINVWVGFSWSCLHISECSFDEFLFPFCNSSSFLSSFKPTLSKNSSTYISSMIPIIHDTREPIIQQSVSNPPAPSFGPSSTPCPNVTSCPVATQNNPVVTLPIPTAT